ncbi:hypothetical protein Tco_0944762 [Tanacetum coccineum]
MAIPTWTPSSNFQTVKAWLRMKDLLRSCHGHGLGKGNIIEIFYHGFNDATQAIHDAEGIFLYKIPNEAHNSLEDRIEALTTKIESQFKEIKGEIKEIRYGCSKCGGPHPSSEYDDKPMGGPEEKAKYAYGGYRGGGYQGNYYSRNSRYWRNRQPQDDHCDSPAHEDDRSTPLTPEKKLEETNFEKTMHLETKLGRLADHCLARPTGSFPSNTQTNPKPSSSNDKPYRPPPAQNEHVNVVFMHSGKSYDPPKNPNDKNTIVHDDSEDEANEAEREEELFVTPRKFLTNILTLSIQYLKFYKLREIFTFIREVIP